MTGESDFDPREGCPRCRRRLMKQKDFTGTIVYACPETDCDYKRDADGKNF